MLHNIIWDSIMAPLMSARIKDETTSRQAMIHSTFAEEGTGVLAKGIMMK